MKKLLVFLFEFCDVEVFGVKHTGNGFIFFDVVLNELHVLSDELSEWIAAVSRRFHASFLFCFLLSHLLSHTFVHFANHMLLQPFPLALVHHTQVGGILLKLTLPFFCLLFFPLLTLSLNPLLFLSFEEVLLYHLVNH